MQIIEVIEDYGTGQMLAVIDLKKKISPSPIYVVTTNNAWMYRDKGLTKPMYELTKGEELKLMACDVEKDKNVGVFQAMGALNGWVSLNYLQHVKGKLGTRIDGDPNE